ncbi:mediator of RNA polymerase II transcription subunit 26-like isoform X1 [Xyrauchen texanus]|uniref:mediator of RNA polymerase II transcription subunit 26-like isoform X1 n=2 Tax=Xyrauchen texanus TaxID=154827 RepID=UPI0022422C39|nr:mediator of RNA polymerase II transcription subunit 26-like isoform X1 [Xyrauchen texanus]
MTTASATPQQMRDRLLQAIDSHSNICNMVAVLDVITNLEKYPITKEALEETRLGKLINDVRKKTKDEDLAKRAKKLLRNWQKLIEPGQSDTPARGVPNVPGSANGGAHPCRIDTPPAVPPPSKIAPELKTRNDIHNTYSPKAEKSSSRKRRGDQRDSPHLPAKISKTSLFEQMYSSPPSNGIRGSPEHLVEKDDAPSDRIRTEHLENDRQNKIPVNAVKPHPSSPGLTKLPSTSSLLKTSVLQQHARMDGGQHQPKSPRNSSSPRSLTHETVAKKSSTHGPKGNLSSPSLNSAQVPSPLPTLQPLNSPAQVCIGDGPSSVAVEGSMHLHRSTERVPQPTHSTTTLEPLSSSPLISHQAKHGLEGTETKGERDGATSNSEGKKRKKYRPRDYKVNVLGQSLEDRTKPVRLKERRLTFDPVTGQIKPLTPKESHHEEECQGMQISEPPRTEMPQQKTPTSVPNPFQQTNWKELSRNEIVQSYLNLQSNVLTSSGAQTHGAHFFMSEYLKREEHDVKESRKTHVLAPSSSDAELPGVTREVTNEDLLRIHKEHWPGVSGCYDTKGNWFDWTECISLDPHGDESKLNILPYVCLD